MSEEIAEDYGRFVCVGDVEAEAVSFLWAPYVPIGKLTLVDGDPGVGKSHLYLAIAAAISKGEGLPGCELPRPENVVILNAEDGIADTLRPRLDSHGADVSRIFAYDGLMTLDGDGWVMVEGAMLRHQPKLLVLDPIVAFLGGKVDINRANAVREPLARLAQIALRHSCAILLIRHLTKGGRERAIYRGLGSIDFVGAARSALLVGVDPNDANRRAFCHAKSNLAPKGPSQGFVLQGGRFQWTGVSDLAEGDLLAPDPTPSARAPAKAGAEDFLREVLERGPVPALRVLELAAARGLSNKTLYRAKHRLRVSSRKVSHPGAPGAACWVWSLAAAVQQVGQVPQTENVTTLLTYEFEDEPTCVEDAEDLQ